MSVKEETGSFCLAALASVVGAAITVLANPGSTPLLTNRGRKGRFAQRSGLRLNKQSKPF